VTPRVARRAAPVAAVSGANWSEVPPVPAEKSVAPRRLDAPRPRDQRYPAPSPVRFTAQRQKVIQTYQSLPAMWPDLAASFPDQVAVIDEHNGGVMAGVESGVQMTFAQIHTTIGRFADGLASLGIGSRCNLALFAENSHRWLIADQAVMRLGCATAVRGASAPADELSFIYSNSNSVALIVESKTVLLDVLPRLPPTAQVRFCVVLLGSVPTRDELESARIAPSVHAKLYKFDEIVQNGKDRARMAPASCIMTPEATRDDIATIIYTSGTTGHPKGVPLTHENLLHQTTYLTIGDVDTVLGDKFVSILPCWHIFERTAEYFVLARGGTLVYSNRRRFRTDLTKHSPSILVVVPRVLESLHASVISKVSRSSALKRAIFFAFAALSMSYIRAKRIAFGKDIFVSPYNFFRRAWCLLKTAFLLPFYALASVLIWRTVRAALGNRVREIICGGGSLALNLEDFFEAAKLNVFVGYGLTETSPVLANRFASRNVRGSAGLPPAGTQLKIVKTDDASQLVRPGETGVLKVRGPQVMKGYYMNEAATKAAIDADGFFDTGDLVFRARTGGDVVIAGRMKDTIVLSNGENVEPAPIEDALLESPYIDQVMIVGQDQKALGALIVVKIDALEAAGFILPDDARRMETLIEAGDISGLKQVEPLLFNDEVVGRAMRAEFDREIATRVQERPNFTPNDRINSYRLLLRPFTIKDGTLTQTLKIKRNAVTAAFAAEIAALF